MQSENNTSIPPIPPVEPPKEPQIPIPPVEPPKEPQILATPDESNRGTNFPKPAFSMPGQLLGNGRRLPYVRVPAVGLVTLFGGAFMMLLLLGMVMIIFQNRVDDLGKFMRIAAVLQDILVFILPAIVAALVVTRLPANLLTVNVKPRWQLLFLAIVTLVVSLPAMEFVIQLNQNMPLPDGIEQYLRQMEDQAADSVDELAGGTSVGELVMGILIVGIMTGIAEELFFRGAMQNLFRATRLNGHLCIWIVAIIFSAAHFQFYGFVPRVLLGAFFGYLLWWSGSVWVPICAHAFNNGFYVVVQWCVTRSGVDVEELANEASDSSFAQPDAATYVIIAVSVLLTALALRQFRKVALRLTSPAQ